MIELQQLTKRFGSFTAVDGIDLTVEPGQVLGFLGPNGAGKSTTMKMVTGFLAPTSGTAIVCGRDVQADPLGVKERVGYLPEGAPLYPDMTPKGLLRFAAKARGLSGGDRRRRVGEAMERLELGSVAKKRIETLSKGFKRRVGLAQAILHDPPVLILDEPTDGLDPNQKAQVRGLIQDMAPGKVIVLSTHILEEVEAVCSRAVIISEGQKRFDDTPASLRGRSSYQNAVELRLVGDAPGVDEGLASLQGATRVERLAEEDGMAGWMVFASEGASLLEGVTQVARDKGWKVGRLAVDRGRLDDVFHQITRSQGEVR